MSSYKANAEAMRDQLVAWRRDLHQHPETAFEEIRTARFVAETLSQLGFEVQTGVGKTGVVGILEGSGTGPTVMIRADMDALPVEEQNEVVYRSQTAQKMHACGHDAHTSIALGVATMLAKQREQLTGRLKFVFQPAEEIGRGAKAMIADGLMETVHPDVVLGLHVWNQMPVGTVNVVDGPLMAGTQTFSVVFEGNGGHAAHPHDTNDPVVVAAQFITAAQTIISRNLDPLQTGVLSITQLSASNAFNVIPSQVELRGTMRAFDSTVITLIKSRLEALAENIGAAFGCTATVSYYNQLKPLINAPEVSQRLRDVFSQDATLTLVDDVRTMGAEDMSEYLAMVPGAYFFVGSANAEKGLDYPHHHPRFDIDEDVLVIGASLLASAVADYVIPS